MLDHDWICGEQTMKHKNKLSYCSFEVTLNLFSIEKSVASELALFDDII